MNALKLTWTKKITSRKWKQNACQVYENMDDIDMYGQSLHNYSKEIHSYRFWEDTFKVYERTEKEGTTLSAKKNRT